MHAPNRGARPSSGFRARGDLLSTASQPALASASWWISLPIPLRGSSRISLDSLEVSHRADDEWRVGL